MRQVAGLAGELGQSSNDSTSCAIAIIENFLNITFLSTYRVLCLFLDPSEYGMPSD